MVKHNETPSTLPNPHPSLRPAEGAGVWIRGLARLLDLAVLAILSFAAVVPVVLVSSLFGISTETLVQRSDGYGLLGLLGGFTAATVYETICEGLYGATFGKKVVRLVVVKETGSPCDLSAALLRSLGIIVDGLFFGLVAVISMLRSPKRQRRGDVWGGTMVIWRDEWDSGPSYRRPVFALVLAGSLAAALVVNVLFTLLDRWM